MTIDRAKEPSRSTKRFGLPVILGLAALAIAAIVFVVLNEPERVTPLEVTPVVRVAANLPLSGGLATYGKSVQEGVNLALEALETDIEFEYDWQDNAGAPQTAVSVFQQQMLDDPDVYTSGVKPQTMAILDQVEARGLPHFVWIFDAQINKASTNNFRTWVSYKIEPAVYFEYAESIGAKRVAIVYVQLPHTVEEFDQIVVPGLREREVDEILVEPFQFGRENFRDIAVKVRDFGPDLIILNGFQAELVGLVRALRPLGLITDGNTIATYDLLDAAKILGGDELEGLRVVAPVFETRPDRAEGRDFRRLFQAKYDRVPLYTHAFAFDMAMIIADAAGRLELPADSNEWIKALQETDTGGVTGPLRFDGDGDLVTPLEVGVYRNGELGPLSEE